MFRVFLKRKIKIARAAEVDTRVINGEEISFKFSWWNLNFRARAYLFAVNSNDSQLKTQFKHARVTIADESSGRF